MNFFKRHKNKFITFGVVSAIGAGGLYLLNKYVEHKVSERREAEGEQRLKQIQRQQQFEHTQNVAEATLNKALLPALKQAILKCFETEPILEKLRRDESSKDQLWHKLKIFVFGKCSAQVLCGSLVAILIRIQFHILAGYNVQNNNPLTSRIQERFLQLSHLFIANQVKNWATTSFMSVLESNLAPLDDLAAELNLTQIQEKLSQIANEGKVMKPVEFLLCGNLLKWDDLTKEESRILQALIMSTMDVIEHKNFQSVLDACISTEISNILDNLASILATGDLIRQRGLPLAKMIPRIDKAFNKGSPTLMNRQLQTFEASIFETFCTPAQS